MSNLSASIPLDAVAALERGRKVEAIKITRQATNVGLKTAKDAVEAYMVANPSTFVRFKEQQRKMAIGPLVLVLVVALAFIVYRFFVGKM
jgi:hypothetical protein